jgi:prophage tail gpP-like protein
MLRLTINNTDYVHFSDLKITLNYTGYVSQFSFNAPFDPDIHRDLFRPLGYQVVKIYYNNELLLTGNIITHNINDEAKATNASFSGYSKCGILQDVSIPTSLYPLQSKDRTLKEIVTRLIKPFGIKATFNSPEADVRYDETVAGHGSSVGAYIHKLCEQRNLRLSHDENGDLVIGKPAQSGIFTNFTDKYRAVQSSLSVDGQSIFSEYTAIRQNSIQNDVQPQSSKSFPIAYRPFVQLQQDGEQGDIEAMAESMRANSGRAISLNLKLDRWTNYENRIYKPGQIIGYQNSQIAIYNLTNMFLETVNLAQENKIEVADLILVPDWTIIKKTPNNPFT